jgi:hypothetical protein
VCTSKSELIRHVVRVLDNRAASYRMQADQAMQMRAAAEELYKQHPAHIDVRSGEDDF